MAQVLVNGRSFSAELILLDKDGTLIDFDTTWSPIFYTWLTALTRLADGPPHMLTQLATELGYNLDSRTTTPNSPFAVESLAEIEARSRRIISQFGHTPAQSARWIRTASAETYRPLTAADVAPLGAVLPTLEGWHAEGLALAVVTSDDRQPTLEMLAVLGISHLLSGIYCADDPLPHKPHPAAIDALSRQLNIPPNSMLMVGDSANDMRFGRNGQVGGCIGVGKPGAIAHLHEADVVVRTIEEIQVQG